MKSGSVRTVAALLVGLAGVAGAASVILTSRPKPKAAPAAPAKPGAPQLVNDGRVLPVGMVSGIPQSVGYDTGPLDYTYNAPGWEYARMGGT